MSSARSDDVQISPREIVTTFYRGRTQVLAIPFPFIKQFGLAKAALLSQLISLDLYFNADKDEDSPGAGWFYRTQDKLKERLGMAEDQQRRLANELKDGGIVKIIKHGLPAKNWYSIDYDRVQKIIRCTENDLIVDDRSGRLRPGTSCRSHRGLDAGLTGDYIEVSNETIKEGEKEDISRRASAVEVRTVQFLPLAEQLAAIIQSKKNIKVTPKKLSAWADCMRLLSEQEEVSRLRQRQALNWYSDHIGQMYVPDIESGDSFRRKFLSLESAIERDQPDRATKNSSHSVYEIKHKKTMAAIVESVQVLPQDVPAIDSLLGPVLDRLKQMGYRASEFREQFSEWLDSDKDVGGSFLKKSTFKPAHFKVDGDTMRRFFRFVRWTNGNDQY